MPHAGRPGSGWPEAVALVEPPHVALTFDDGPDPRTTPRLLDLLQRYQAQATFFVIGSRACRHPDLVRRAVREGHAVGNHSHRHSLLLPFLPEPLATADLAACSSAVEAITGERPGLFRPPRGWRTASLDGVATRLKMRTVGWTVDSRDWLDQDPARLVHRVSSGLRTGAVLLWHDGGDRREGTLKAIEALLRSMDRLGLRAVSLHDMALRPP